MLKAKSWEMITNIEENKAEITVAASSKTDFQVESIITTRRLTTSC